MSHIQDLFQVLYALFTIWSIFFCVYSLHLISKDILPRIDLDLESLQNVLGKTENGFCFTVFAIFFSLLGLTDCIFYDDYWTKNESTMIRMNLVTAVTASMFSFISCFNKIFDSNVIPIIVFVVLLFRGGKLLYWSTFTTSVKSFKTSLVLVVYNLDLLLTFITKPEEQKGLSFFTNFIIFSIIAALLSILVFMLPNFMRDISWVFVMVSTVNTNEDLNLTTNKMILTAGCLEILFLYGFLRNLIFSENVQDHKTGMLKENLSFDSQQFVLNSV